MLPHRGCCATVSLILLTDTLEYLQQKILQQNNQHPPYYINFREYIKKPIPSLKRNRDNFGKKAVTITQKTEQRQGR